MSMPTGSQPKIIAKGAFSELHIYEDKIHIKSGGDLGLGKVGKLYTFIPGKIFKIDKK